VWRTEVCRLCANLYTSRTTVVVYGTLTLAFRPPPRHMRRSLRPLRVSKGLTARPVVAARMDAVAAQAAQTLSDDDTCLHYRLPPRSGYGLFVFQGTWDETLALLLRLALCRESINSAMKTLSLSVGESYGG
jgi:hypothetical protein